MSRRLAALVIAVVIVAGVVGLVAVFDGTRPAASPIPSTPTPGPATGSPAPTPRASTNGSSVVPTTGSPGSPSPSGISTSSSPGTARFRLNVEAPGCARLGVPIGVTVRTEPQADIALILSFSDGASHDSYQLGTADAQGRFFTQMAIPATAPSGPAKVLAAAGKEHLGGDAVERPFTVVEPTGSCP